MKHQSIVCFMNALVVLAGLSACSTVFGQEVGARQHVYHPGETVHLDIAFKGDGADQILNMGVHTSLRDGGVPEQQGLLDAAQDQLNAGVQKTATGFSASIAIPQTAPTGNYNVQITVNMKPFGQNIYRSGSDFAYSLRIENPAKIPRPEIIVH